MRVGRKPRKPVSRAQYPKFFAMLRRAAQNLGLDTPQEVEEYRRRVMREEAGCASIKEMDGKGEFDACIRRFAADAGEYLEAVEIGLMEMRRRAFVAKVMCCQIMQLKGGSEADARGYLDGIIRQARIPCGVNAADDGYWMDVAPDSLQRLVQILDAYRRKLVKANFPDAPVGFDPTVRYAVEGMVRTRTTGLPASYYADIPFRVNVRRVR